MCMCVCPVRVCVCVCAWYKIFTFFGMLKLISSLFNNKKDSFFLIKNFFFQFYLYAFMGFSLLSVFFLQYALNINQSSKSFLKRKLYYRFTSVSCFSLYLGYSYKFNLLFYIMFYFLVKRNTMCKKIKIFDFFSFLMIICRNERRFVAHNHDNWPHFPLRNINIFH